MLPFPCVQGIDSDPATFLSHRGKIFAVFDERTQGSGNVSYGVEVDGRRYFVKTAGRSDDDRYYLYHGGRVSLLRNAVRLAESSDHRTLSKLRQVVESTWGPMLIYDWVEGELMSSCLDRVGSLNVREVGHLVTEVYDLHRELASLGWIANDFYDGAMIYDFQRRRVHVIDLDNYNLGNFTNRMGRMFGSSRFMAPEEFEFGATIDERTTVFTMGRTAAVLMSDNSLERGPFRRTDGQYEVMVRCCAEDPDDRFQTVAEMFAAWVAPRD
ncbi:MAG: hypothetical protein OXD46_13305 [Chloroflexi bacterium]|nr:hypothetical protein [Chloroflexota bacterium]